MIHKNCGNGRHFRWSKRTHDRTVTYRLFRRDHTGKWHFAIRQFRPMDSAEAMAFELRRVHHQLREQVDAIQLAAWDLA